MATTETRVRRGRRLGMELQYAALAELETARIAAGVSQATLARHLRISQAELSRILREERSMTVIRLAELASLLGLRPSLRLHPFGEPLRDAGQLKLIARFRSLLAPEWHVLAEAPFPTLGDLRSWDLLIRLGTTFRVGVEAETRIRDVQELVRRIRQRELHGGANLIVVLLSDTADNRRNVDQLRMALGERYTTSPRALLAALRQGTPPPASGVLLL